MVFTISFDFITIILFFWTCILTGACIALVLIVKSLVDKVEKLELQFVNAKTSESQGRKN